MSATINSSSMRNRSWNLKAESLVRGLRNDVHLQRRIGGGHVRRRQAQLAANDVAPLSDRTGLVERNLPVGPLPTKSTIARHNQLFRRNVLQRGTDDAGDI